MIAGLVADLLDEARATDERRILVLAGDRRSGREALATVIDAVGTDPADIPLVSDEGGLGLDRVPHDQAGRLLGTTNRMVVFDAHSGLSPNALGRVVGTVDGGGLLILLCPALDGWPERPDPVDDQLAVPPYTVADVSGHFRRRFIRTLRAHRGIAILNVDDDTVIDAGRTDPPPRLPPPPIELPDGPTFPVQAYESCRTQDQVDGLLAFERLEDPRTALVLEADRGRGKSSVAGLAAACFAHAGEAVTVTAPAYRGAREAFQRAIELLTRLEALVEDLETDPREIDTVAGGRITFEPPTEVDPSEPDVLIVDEAAAIGVPLLASYLDASRVAFTTTIHGYEGTGRGFAIRFRDRLATSDHAVSEHSLDTPIRYAAGDPVEVWSFRALLLDAAPAVDQVVETADPQTVDYRALSGSDLVADEPLLREVFGLLVLAHYRTEPDDLARLLDAPNIRVRAFLYGDHVAAVALLAREGDLPASLRATMYAGGRVRGNMLPDVLTSQLRDEAAGNPVGRRVMRIATHPTVRRSGLGTALLRSIHDEFRDEVDWFGVGFGATPGLISFWDQNGYHTVHLSTTRNDVSGEHSALMLRPTTAAGEALHRRHADWFAARVASMLSGPLRDVDTDVVRATLRATDVVPDRDLTERGWRLVAATAYGPGLVDVDLRPFRRLAVAHLIDPRDPDLLTARQERLLVRKVLQGWSWQACAAALDFHSTGECMRALGAAFVPLVDAYGTPVAHEEADRYRDPA